MGSHTTPFYSIFGSLSDAEVHKDAAAMAKMPELVKMFGGLTIYRM